MTEDTRYGDVQHADVQYTLDYGDYLDVVPLADNIMPRMSDNVAATLRHILDQLVRLLDGGAPPELRRRCLGLRRPLSVAELPDRMFPAADPSSAAAADFRQRLSTGRPGGVLAWRGAGVDQADLTRRWLSYLTDRLVLAACPAVAAEVAGALRATMPAGR